MSRSNYSDDLDPLALGRWRAQVKHATEGKRGQKFFRDLVAALDALPEKKLAAAHLETTGGTVCALGALGRLRGVQLAELDTYDHEQLGEAFNIASQLAAETMYQNDDEWSIRRATDEDRWRHVRDWAARQVTPTEEELLSVEAKAAEEAKGETHG
jgi:hypothetical protein